MEVKKRKKVGLRGTRKKKRRRLAKIQERSETKFLFKGELAES